jgi:protein-L-isoaspartate O-methyltransferase
MTLTDQSSVAEVFSALSPSEFVPASMVATPGGTDSEGALRTFQRADGLVLSAISNRAFLSDIIARIMPLRGKRVFEIGSGTGYLAAVLAALCGPDGMVQGCEIIPELYTLSISNLERIGATNVQLFQGDFVDILRSAEMFDAVIATSCMSQIHAAIVQSCSPAGGCILLPVEIPGGGDCFTIFQRDANRLTVVDSRLSVSVPSTGAYSSKPIWAPPVEQVLPGWETAPKTEIRSPAHTRHFIHDTLAFRSFLLLREPSFQAVNLGAGHLAFMEDMAFGLICDRTSSCCLRTAGGLILRGAKGLELASRLTMWERDWAQRSKPSLADYRYEIPIDPRQGFAFDPGFLNRITLVRDP